MKTKKLLIMGPPGAGKGTQAANIVREYGVVHISTGDMFRAAMKNGTDMGKLAKSYIEKGELVPDSVTVGIVRDRLAEKDVIEHGFLLDGFPRNLEQAYALDEILKDLGYDLTGVINIDVDAKVLIDRIVGRRICKKCGATFHVLYNKPKVENVCDNCGSELYTRPDDNEETATNRLSVYENQTAPLLEFYKKRNLLMNVDGALEFDSVFVEIRKYLD